MADDLSLTELCQEYLSKRWQDILDSNETKSPIPVMEVEYPTLKETIRDCLTSETKSYRYVLPTQLLSKTVHHNLDSRSLQAGFQGEGAFDARTIAHKVVVPFDKQNHRDGSILSAE